MASSKPAVVACILTGGVAGLCVLSLSMPLTKCRSYVQAEIHLANCLVSKGLRPAYSTACVVVRVSVGLERGRL